MNRNLKVRMFLILDKIKNIVLIIGVASICCGVLFLGGTFGASPKRDLSIFNNIADTGTFSAVGAIIICIGVLFILASWIISKIKL
jgi:hypothetical protein